MFGVIHLLRVILRKWCIWPCSFLFIRALLNMLDLESNRIAGKSSSRRLQSPGIFLDIIRSYQKLVFFSFFFLLSLYRCIFLWEYAMYFPPSTSPNAFFVKKKCACLEIANFLILCIFAGFCFVSQVAVFRPFIPLIHSYSVCNMLRNYRIFMWGKEQNETCNLFICIYLCVEQI